MRLIHHGGLLALERNEAPPGHVCLVLVNWEKAGRIASCMCRTIERVFWQALIREFGSLDRDSFDGTILARQFAGFGRESVPA